MKFQCSSMLPEIVPAFQMETPWNNCHVYFVPSASKYLLGGLKYVEILQPTSEILTIGLYFGCSFKFTTDQQPDVRESLQRNISSKALTNVLWTVNNLQAQQLSDRPLFRQLDLAIGGFNKLNAHNDGSVPQFLEWQDIALFHEMAMNQYLWKYHFQAMKGIITFHGYEIALL